ncbi:hypothetical protein BSLA_03r1421 [Burkholderia stabilis]|nr:hypothetical protein BSLA_03r1421 [Burkholderia stabilis]
MYAGFRYRPSSSCASLRDVRSAMLAHFGVDLVQFALLTYPSIARA